MLPSTTPEQRSRFYTDLDSLLAPGFLTHPIVINGVRLHLRSLGAGDLFMLKARTEGGTVAEWRVWAIATSIWMIDGRTVLGHDDAIPFLAGYVRKLPKPAVEILFSILLGLWVRLSSAVDMVEVYCFETISRYKWKTTGGDGLLQTGVPGAEKLGRNAVQRIWHAFNEMEDTKRAEETAWEGYKLVASSNAPKAIRKMDDKDKERRRLESEERQKRLDRLYYHKIGVITAKGEYHGADGSMHRIEGAKSVEDLEDEMRRWVTEDYDLHDRVVAAYKAHIRAKNEQEREDRAQRREALQRKREEMGWESGDFRPQPLIAMTAAQLQLMLQERGAGAGQPGVTFLPNAPNAGRIYEKYVGAAPDAGRLQVVGDRVVDPGANPATDSRTLNDLIKSRNPAFGAGE